MVHLETTNGDYRISFILKIVTGKPPISCLGCKQRKLLKARMRRMSNTDRMLSGSKYSSRVTQNTTICMTQYMGKGVYTMKKFSLRAN